VVAHSLGGIASVELFSEPDAPKIEGLITVGSQAPLLYEIDCLPVLRLDASATPEKRLRDEFPRWLNVYDPNDFLSYVAAPVFGARVEDVEVKSDQPFPASHSAYWGVKEFARRLAGFIK
jgi:hypothetical protein